jgi:hypothetical protein
MLEFPVTATLTRKDPASRLQILDQLANLPWHWLFGSKAADLVNGDTN